MNFNTVVGLGLAAVGVYMFSGLIAAAALHLKGLHRIDSGTADAGVLFRLLITPGMVALWPLLLGRWRAAARSEPRFGEADRPRSSARLRTIHLRLVAVTAVAVSALFAVGLMVRPGAPTKIAAAVDLIPDPLPLSEVSASWQEPFLGLPITANLRTDDEGRKQIELVISRDLEVPDVALYWLAGDGSGPLGTGVFLGTVWGPDHRLFALPPEASEGGSLVLYSMSHKERVGRLTVATSGGE